MFKIFGRYKKKFPLIATTSIIVASTASFMVEFIPHSLLINKYKNIIQLKKYQEPLPLAENVKNLFNEVIDDLKIDAKKKDLYCPFTCTGFDLIHAGSIFSKFGSIIGIPINYASKNKFSLNASEIRIGYDQERLNIYHPAANDLIDSLILSDKAKKFGIAREILMINQNLIYFRSIESPIMIAGTGLTAEFLRLKFSESYKISFSMKAIIFGITGLVGYSLWFQMRDSLNSYFEKSVDKQLANLSPDYIEGGREFYEKLIKKNIALRTLMGDIGVKEFNKDGDEVVYIRRKKVPLTERKQFFNDITFSESEQCAV